MRRRHRALRGLRALRVPLASLVVLNALFFAQACNDERPPAVDVPAVAPPVTQPPKDVAAKKPAQCAGVAYQPVGPVEHYFRIGLDARDVRAAMAAGDWTTATTLYANGKNQVRPDGTVRSMASLAVAAEEHFPRGTVVHGRARFIDMVIRDGLTGVGRAHGNSDAVRRHAVESGMQWLIYGKVLEELDNTKKHIAAKELDNEKGAPHTVDEAWAAIAGSTDETGARPYSLLGAAAIAEEGGDLQGQLCVPLEAAFMSAQAAAKAGDAPAFEKLRQEIVGRLNAIFTQRVMQAAAALEGEATEEGRRPRMAEAWGCWQIIRATVSAASPTAAQTIEGVLTRPPREPFTASETQKVRAALHDPAVWAALQIPAALK